MARHCCNTSPPPSHADMPKRAAACSGGTTQPKPAATAGALAGQPLATPKRKRQLTTTPKAMAKRDLDGDATRDTPAATRKKRTRLFPTDPATVRRVLAFDIGIVNFAHAVVTLAGDDEFAIESLGANNIMRADPPSGPLPDDEIIAAAAAAGPRRRKRPGEAAAAGPKPKGRGAKEPLKVLTERLTAYLWARADRLVGQRPHAIVIEQQSKKALRLSALGAVIHSFVLNYYMARGEEPPPVFMQSGRQKLRVVFRPLPSSADVGDWRLDGAGSSSGHAPSLMTRFLVSSSSSSSSSTKSSAKTTTVITPKRSGGGAPKAKSKGKQKKAAQGAVWRENKKHAVDNFGPILAHYPGCRRWKPLFDQSKKKDDLADAALHAIFLLKAGGTSLARTKDIDENSLVILPHRAPQDNGEEKGTAAKSVRAPRRKRVPPSKPHGIDDTSDPGKDDGDDGIIDLVHYGHVADRAVQNDSAASQSSTGVTGRTGTISLSDDADGGSDAEDDGDDGDEPLPKRARRTRAMIPQGTTQDDWSTKQETDTTLYDDDDDGDSDGNDADGTDEEHDDSDDDDNDDTDQDEDEEDGSDDDWALDLGIC